MMIDVLNATSADRRTKNDNSAATPMHNISNTNHWLFRQNIAQSAPVMTALTHAYFRVDGVDVISEHMNLHLLTSQTPFEVDLFTIHKVHQRSTF
jgi:hypothetical protein